jgi:hypothetical protein
VVLLAEVRRLEHADLAAYTIHMVLSQNEFAAFRKEVERVLGGGLGIRWRSKVVAARVSAGRAVS